MAIPKHNEIRLPVLKYLKSSGPAGSKDMVSPLGTAFNLTPEEINQMYESGKGPVFKDRISWAITYLKMAGLINLLERGIYEISQKGIELLATPEKIDSFIEEQQRLKEESKKGEMKAIEQSPKPTNIKIDPTESSTPQDKLEESFSKIRKSILEDIIDVIISKSPGAFEKLVVTLLQKMGYGAEIKDSATVTKATRDKGIDGIIKEDVLGFGRIYIQAKKYDRHVTVPSHDIQKFAGALLMAGASKGVFITTSKFSGPAKEAVKELKQQVITIDGEQLAQYIYEFGLGLQIEQVLTVKKLDWDFWDEMESK